MFVCFFHGPKKFAAQDDLLPLRPATAAPRYRGGPDRSGAVECSEDGQQQANPHGAAADCGNVVDAGINWRGAGGWKKSCTTLVDGINHLAAGAVFLPSTGPLCPPSWSLSFPWVEWRQRQAYLNMLSDECQCLSIYYILLVYVLPLYLPFQTLPYCMCSGYFIVFLRGACRVPVNHLNRLQVHQDVLAPWHHVGCQVPRGAPLRPYWEWLLGMFMSLLNSYVFIYIISFPVCQFPENRGVFSMIHGQRHSN